MGKRRDNLPVDRTIDLVLHATEQLLSRSDDVVDAYRSVFFSGDDPGDITLRLGELGSELVRLADIAIALSTLNESVDSYQSLVSAIETANGAIESDRSHLRLLQRSAVDDTGDEPF